MDESAISISSVAFYDFGRETKTEPLRLMQLGREVLTKPRDIVDINFEDYSSKSKMSRRPIAY